MTGGTLPSLCACMYSEPKANPLVTHRYLYLIGETSYAAVLFGLVLPQMFSQISFLQARKHLHMMY